MRIVFMGTPEFAAVGLRKLVAAAPEHQVVGVYTQPDRPVGRGLELKASPVKILALENQIPVFQPERLSQPGEFEKLAELKPDVIVVIAFGQLLKRNVLDLPRYGCVNVHGSLLPRWRGAAPIQWAVAAGDLETGVMTMVMAEKLDAGPVLLEARTPIGAADTAGALHDRLAVLGADLLLPTLNGLQAGTIAPKVQDESQVTYASKLNKAMEWLKPTLQTAKEMDGWFRALHPWPGCSVRMQGQRLKLKSLKLLSEGALPGISKQSPGVLFESCGVLCLQGTAGMIEIKSVQWEGKKEISASDFLNGLAGRGIALPAQVDDCSESNREES